MASLACLSSIVRYPLTLPRDADLPSVAVAARNLMELADYADLSTIMCAMNHRRAGYPFASTVDFATDADGFPIFCLTPLAMHTRNLVRVGGPVLLHPESTPLAFNA